MALRPIVLVDFDQTITKVDTTSLLGQFGLDQHNSSLPWSYFVDAYMDDYNKREATLPHNLTFEQRIDAFRPVEKASLDRINEKHVFQNLTREQIFEKGKQMGPNFLQPNVLEGLKEAHDLAIVSVNWSKDWILGALAPLNLSRKQIYCNDLVLDDRGLTTGEITAELLTAVDKKRQVSKILQHYPEKRPTVYIGDSSGDVLTLVQADVGVIIGNNTGLIQQLQDEFNYNVTKGIPSKRAEKHVYQVDGWDEIIASGILKSL
ncbi:hypothetical protein VTP01DRAFT_1582 [Rhizomucor pusillus]|uniref:uncharacterized protein n=1 Tax=Rhizomucor pusillus TaxID=4840 RepID=UPI0037427793